MAINNPVIADADIIQDTAVAIQEKDHGGKMEHPDFPSRIRALPTQDNALLNSLINRSITSIENSEVTNIGTYAFSNCSNLTNVSLPNATIIGANAFSNCSNLTNVSLPNANIGANAFWNCSKLTNVSFPNATSISANAFNNCSKLTNVSFPNATIISANAFNNCSKLTSVILGARAILTNSNSFSGADNAITYVQPEDLSWYSTATNWSALYTAGRVKSIEELPT